MPRYQVKLDGFTFTQHVGPDGKVHLKPRHEGGYSTRAEIGDAYEVEAQDELHAQAVFQKAMGIKTTSREYRVVQVAEERPEHSKAEKKKATAGAAG